MVLCFVSSSLHKKISHMAWNGEGNGKGMYDTTTIIISIAKELK